VQRSFYRAADIVLFLPFLPSCAFFPPVWKEETFSRRQTGTLQPNLCGLHLVFSSFSLVSASGSSLLKIGAVEAPSPSAFPIPEKSRSFSDGFPLQALFSSLGTGLGSPRARTAWCYTLFLFDGSSFPHRRFLPQTVQSRFSFSAFRHRYVWRFFFACPAVPFLSFSGFFFVVC